MASSMNLTFDATIDLDSLFTFNYNFDRLKAVIDILLQNQKAHNQKFIDIQETIEVKNKKIANLEKEVQTLTNQVRTMNTTIIKIEKERKQMGKKNEISKISENSNEYGERDNNDIDNIIDRRIENETDTIKYKTESSNKIQELNIDNVIDNQKINKETERINFNKKGSSNRDILKDNINTIKEQTKENAQEKYNRNLNDFNLQSNLLSFDINNKEDRENLFNIIKRLLFLESQIKNSLILNEDMNEVKQKLENHEDSIQYNNEEITKVQQRIRHHDIEIEDIKTKLNDHQDISDLLNKNLTSEGGDKMDNKKLELIIGLIKTIENKVNSNTTQNKKLEEELNKNKTEIMILKTDFIQTNNKLDTSREKIEGHTGDIKEIKEKLNSHEVLIKNLSDMIEAFQKETEDKFESINITLKNLENIPPPAKDSKENLTTFHNELSDVELKAIKDLQKRLADMEKNYKILISTVNLDPIYKEISKINESMSTKLGQHEMNEMRNNNSQLILQINYIKDLITQLQDDKNSTSLEITRLKKKIDNLNSNLTMMSRSHNDAEPNTSMSYKVVQLDNNKYVDIATFIEFKNNVSKEIEGIELTLSEIKKLIEEILFQLKAKINDTDLKNLEEYLMTKIEELKTGFTRKFADKLETSKNFKYLDQQIKHIIDVYIKRMEKGDNWLLAKKPLEGFACASCESYIGDLKENNAYIPWNKYPMRDPNDKLYRMGNGFSKMLQLINIENSPKSFQTSADFFVKSQEQIEADQKKKNMLPKLKLKVKKNPGNMSADDIEQGEEMEIKEELENNQEPKIVKIYKKVKA